MRVLFVTMVWPLKGDVTNMYTDLMSEFVMNGHDVSVVTLMEVRCGKKTFLSKENGISVLRVRCGNIQKTNKYKKVISSALANFQILLAVRKYLHKSGFDLLIFALPPLTVAPAIRSLKKRFNSSVYLLLKEFWPQDPADLGAMRKNGIVWKSFECLANMLYNNSDYIGTMSETGAKYFIQNNPDIKAIVETCPNCLSKNVILNSPKDTKEAVFGRNQLPLDKIILLFGGNLGVSQGIPEMIDCIKSVSDYDDFCFLIVGDGTEAIKVRESLCNQKNVRIRDWIPSEDYENIVRYSDVGLIFLFPEYSVPNVPSRMVGYLKYGLPVMACVDKATDAGEIVQRANCGYSIINGDTESFRKKVDHFRDSGLRKEMSLNSRALFEREYTSEKCYEKIMSHF